MDKLPQLITHQLDWQWLRHNFDIIKVDYQQIWIVRENKNVFQFVIVGSSKNLPLFFWPVSFITLDYDNPSP